MTEEQEQWLVSIHNGKDTNEYIVNFRSPDPGRRWDEHTIVFTDRPDVEKRAKESNITFQEQVLADLQKASTESPTEEDEPWMDELF